MKEINAEYFFSANSSPLIVGAIALVVLTLLFFVIPAFIKQIGKRTNRNFLVAFSGMIKAPLFIFFLTINAQLIITSATIVENIDEVLRHIITLLYIASATWLFICFVRAVKISVIDNYDIDRADNLRARKVLTQFNIIEKIVIFILVLIAIAISLMTFESIRRIGISLFASAGVAGLIIGLAAQKVIGSVLAGIQLAVTQPIRIDDVVIVEGEWGKIEEISLTYVVIHIWDRRRLIVPTKYFLENPFQNWTRVSADILGTVFLYTDYRIPFESLREEFSRILTTTDLWDKDVKVLQVTDIKENTVEIRLLMSAKDSSTAWDLRVLIREKMIEYIQKNFPEHLPKTRVMLDKSQLTMPA